MTDDDVLNRRVTAMAGLLLAVFFLVGLLLPGTPPKADDSVQKITVFLTDKRSELLAGNFILGLGGAAFLVFASGLRRYLAAAGRDADGLAAAAFAGAVAGVSLLLAGAAVLNGIAFEAAPAGGDLVRAFFDTASSLFAVAGLALFVFFAAASWAAARAGAFPVWATWLGAAAGVLQLLGGIALFAKSGLFASGGAIAYVAPLVSLVWTIGVCVMLLRQAAGVPTSASGSP